MSPVVINADVMPSSNPHSWLMLLGDPPRAPGPRCMVGTLRPEHRTRINSAAEFAAAKLLIAVGDEAAPWMPQAYRHEVLLPPGADDRFLCPRALFEDIDTVHPAAGKALVGYITLTWTPQRLHHQWLLARTLAAELVHEHAVAALLVQHVPGLVASTSEPHTHILIAGPRMLTAIGWGPYRSCLMGDRVWPLVRSRFDALFAEPT